MIITISGVPGSGKTTVAKIVSEKLSFKLLIGGRIFRDQAKKMHISLAKMGSFAERNETFDKSLDEYILAQMRSGENMVVESRLSGWLCKLNDIESFKVFIAADEDVRFARVKKSLEKRREEEGDVPKLVRERENSEWQRYKKYYGIDLHDTSIYDLKVDATKDSAERVAEVIISGLDFWERTKRAKH